MLSDEERQAIEYLKRHIIPYYGRKGTIEFMINDTLLNLIEKQQKEIEKLKEKNKELNRLKGFEMLDIFNMGKQSSRQRIEFDYVDKEKIKAKIEEYKKQQKEEPDAYLCIKVLSSLLEKE